jgi:hypothetical protein
MSDKEIAELLRTWELHLRGVRRPSPALLFRWSELAGHERVLFAIQRTGRKYQAEIKSGSGMSRRACMRYAGSVVRNISQEWSESTCEAGIIGAWNHA